MSKIDISLPESGLTWDWFMPIAKQICLLAELDIPNDTNRCALQCQYMKQMILQFDLESAYWRASLFTDRYNELWESIA